MRFHRLRACLFLVTVLIAGAAVGQGRQVAITIDDLPRGGDGGPYDFAGMRAMTETLMRPFREQKIPVIGFVNAGLHSTGDPSELRKILDLWLQAGAELGNHAYSHLDINEVAFDAGFSWIHRWSQSKGMAPKGEPEPAKWVQKAWAASNDGGG